MQFTFNGTLEQLKNIIHAKAQELDKDIIMYHNEPNMLEIGFQRLGHSGGRFFVANITEADGHVILTGEATDIYANQSQNKVRRFIDDIAGYFIIYIFMALIPLVVWSCIFHFAHIWIPLVLPIPIMIVLRIININHDKKTDDKFIDFMSTFTTVETTKAE